MPMAALISAFLLAFLLLWPGTAGAMRYLSANDAQIYQQAFALLSQKRDADAISVASHATDPLLNDVMTGLLLGQENSSASFAAYKQYLDSHPQFPESLQKAIARQAEQHLDPHMPSSEVLEFFAHYPAQSDEGFRRYVSALQATGRASDAHAAIRQRWREKSMGDKEQELFLHSFGSQITPADTYARLDHLLWESQFEQVKHLAPLLSPNLKKLAAARIALMQQSRKGPKLLKAVPAALQNDPGLVYERIKMHFKNNETEQAVGMVERVGVPSDHKDAWWNLRNRAVRELLQIGQYPRAYALANNHGLTEGQGFAEAEFLSGWIALRFLHEPQKALDHFEKLYGETSSPVTLARAAYWAARASEDLGLGPQAREWYGRALVYGTTYYAQLAAARLYRDSRISVPPANITAADQERFENAPEVARIAQLEQAGQPELAETFALAYARHLAREQDFRLLCNLSLALRQGELAVRVAKEAAKKKILLPGEGYPLLSQASSMPREQAALIHALIRQESEFDPNAVSPSGAQGLMQMLPATAQHVARQSNLGDTRPNLFDVETSLRYGTAYVNELENDFGGYLPLVIASYNAGPASVHNWMTHMGDPRAGQVDIVDWIESIPFAETRNYVQRVLEGLQIYRARLSGGTTMLALESDLHAK